MTKRNVKTPPLTVLHQAILDVVWSQGPVTAEQVREALRPAHPLTDSSIRTLLRRLEARGHLVHRTVGRMFVYEATVPPARAAARAVKEIIERFWAGSAEAFLVGMVDEQVLPAETLERLSRRVKRAGKKR